MEQGACSLPHLFSLLFLAIPLPVCLLPQICVLDLFIDKEVSAAA